MATVGYIRVSSFGRTSIINDKATREAIKANAGGLSKQALSDKYGVSRATTYNILSNK